MNNDQLNLFSQQNETMAKGYEKLALFRFDDAEKVFREIKNSYVDPDPEVDAALSCTNDWKDLFEQFGSTQSSDSISLLYDEIKRYDFSNRWGLEKFRSALISHLIELMQQKERFYINEQVTLPDLYIQLEKHDKAESVLIYRLTSCPTDNLARFRLAQLQWNHNQKGEAKRNYSIGLLSDPLTVPFEFLKSEEIADLIRNYGSEMAPAYGWVKGKLPLLKIPDYISPVSENHHKAIECYRLLIKAERTVRNNQMDLCVEYRKELKERDPDFYEVYYSLISKRTQPYFH